LLISAVNRKVTFLRLLLFLGLLGLVLRAYGIEFSLLIILILEKLEVVELIRYGPHLDLLVITVNHDSGAFCRQTGEALCG
jgi:hypothetical protein